MANVDLLFFVLVSMGVIVVPGPNVLVIVSTSLSNGIARGLQTVAGTSLAMALQLLIAAVGTGWLVTLFTDGLVALKWIGVAYLAYLGISQLIKAASTQLQPITALGSFHRGFWVSLTNPKTILFFSAFLPQFTTPDGEYLAQITWLSIVFWILAVILDSGYAMLAGKLSEGVRFLRDKRWQNRVSAAMYLIASVLLALGHRAQ